MFCSACSQRMTRPTCAVSIATVTAASVTSAGAKGAAQPGSRRRRAAGGQHAANDGASHPGMSGIAGRQHAAARGAGRARKRHAGGVSRESAAVGGGAAGVGLSLVQLVAVAGVEAGGAAWG